MRDKVVLPSHMCSGNGDAVCHVDSRTARAWSHSGKLSSYLGSTTKVGRYGEVVNYLQEAVSRNRHDPDIRVHLQQVRQALQKTTPMSNAEDSYG
jgi:hypothetical protein